MDVVEQVFLHNENFHVVTAEGGSFVGRTVIVASGVRPRTLGLPGEQRLRGAGVSYSATSHGPLFADRRVVVIGDDLRALRAVLELRLIAEHVTQIVPNQAEPQSGPLSARLIQDPHVAVLSRHTISEIVGDACVSGVVGIAPDQQTQLIPAEGVFIECGLEADTGFLSALVERIPNGQIVVNDSCATSTPGIFAAGDVTSTAYAERDQHLLGIGAKAGLGACAYLLEGALLPG